MALTLKTFVRAQGATQFAGEHVLAGERVTVGRSAGCTLQLHDPERLLSRVHVEFLRIVGGYRLKVASTHYPVTVNGREYPPASEVTVRTGDCVVMDVHELEIVSTGDDTQAVVPPAVVPQAVVARAVVPQAVVPQAVVHQPSALVAVPMREMQVAEARAPVQVEPVTMMPARGSGWGAKRFGMVAAVIVGVVVAGATVKSFLPDGEAAKQAEQEIARLQAVSKSMFKLVESDRQEVKEAATIAGQEVERLRAQVSAARVGAERQNVEAALLEALQTARLNASLEQGLRKFAESAEGIPRIEGALAAAAVADRVKDQTSALKQLGEAVAALTQMRAKIADERKTLQAELARRREAFQVAQGRARADDDVRATAEARARAESLERARVATAARSQAANEAIAKAQSEAAARAQAEARAKSEAEAQAQAQASAEADARARAAAEARAKAETAARQRADAAEKAAAETAARAEARAEARAKAEEARAQAEEARAQARAKAESDRRNAEAVMGIIRSFAR